MKRGHLISVRNQFCRKSKLFGSPLLYFNFKSFLDAKPSSFIRYQCILEDSGILFTERSNFYKLKSGVLISVTNQFCRISELFGSPLLYFNFTSFLDPNSSSLIRFQCILHDSGVPFSGFWNFYKLKSGDLISSANQFCRLSELFGPPFCILVLKVLRTEFLPHSLDFNAFYMIYEHLSQSLQLFVN